MNAHVHVGVDAHDDDDDIEGVDEEHINHLEIGSLGHHLINGGLEGGNDQALVRLTLLMFRNQFWV